MLKEEAWKQALLKILWCMLEELKMSGNGNITLSLLCSAFGGFSTP